jgi:hypothetical protein
LKLSSNKRPFLGLHLVVGVLVFASMAIILCETAEDIRNGEPSPLLTTSSASGRTQVSALDQGNVRRYLISFDRIRKLSRDNLRFLFALAVPALLARGGLAFSLWGNVAE